MKVRNIHDRELPATAAAVGGLIDSLASPEDALWPKQSWPRMKFDRALGVGATGGMALLSWPVLFGPLHDALIEDSLVTAQVSLGQPPQVRPWSLWVKVLRWVLSGRKARAQII
jgi:hypothetical protein